VPVEVGTDYRAPDWTQRFVSWDDFLDYAFTAGASSAQPPMYLAQHDLFQQFPALRSDIIVPDYVYSGPQAPGTYPTYRPPGNCEELVMNLWIGPEGTVSPAHTDPFFNCYFQVVGRKSVWLAPPEVASIMLPPNRSGESPNPLSLPNQPQKPESTNSADMLSNTSVFDVFTAFNTSSNDTLSPSSTSVENTDPKIPDKDVAKADRYDLNRFREQVAPRAMSVVLEAGDMLFFPPGWWHAMRSEERSCSVSMWF